MSSSEPILDLKTDTAEALPGEKHASFLSRVPAVTSCSDAPVVLMDLHLATGTR